MTTPLDTKAARAICEAATEGQWEAAEFERWADNGRMPSVMAWRIFLRGHRNQATNSRDCDWTEHDARFIAAARTGWEEALDEVDRLNLIIADTATVLTAKVDAFEIENARLLRGARDAIDLAMSRMSPATYNKLLQLIDEATGIASDAVDSTSEAGTRLREIREEVGL